MHIIKVIKTKYYSPKKYCEYGGDIETVPLGTKGTIKSLSDRTKTKCLVIFNIEFGEIRWHTNIGELSHAKITNWRDRIKRGGTKC